MTVSSVFGFFSGFVVKKAGTAAAVIVGGIYCLQQALAYGDYVHMNWPKVEKDMVALLDVNKDGKVDEKDFNEFYVKWLGHFQHNPYSVSGGFGAGFLYGVKLG